MANLESLALEICSKVSDISKTLAADSTPAPSFEEDSFNDFGSSQGKADLYLRDARNKLINCAQDIIRLVSGPTDQILTLAFSAADPANLGIIVRFNIPQAIPNGTTISAESLAGAVGLPVDTLVRVVRFAISNGIFNEPERGRFGHSAASALLARNPHVRSIALFATHELASTLVRLPDGLKLQQELPAEKAPHATFNIAYPDFADAFDYFEKSSVANDRYHRYLQGRINTSRWAVEHLISAWDWPSVGSGTIIDCGGSIGHTCVALAPICPHASFIVQDMSLEAMASGKAWIENEHPTLASRIVFAEHDFFQPQPHTSADIYVFRHILHDWSDADCLRILHALVPALKDGARVLVSEAVVPEGVATRSADLDRRQVRTEDFIMLAIHNARERDVSAFVRLFKEASACFHFKGVTGGIGGAFQSLLEFEFCAEGVVG
ncbi:MAG: hypothetical protein Q9195_007799 [Heterodermia aff. obscurata]